MSHTHERKLNPTMSNQSGTQAVDRAARLLAEVVHSADPMTFTGLSTATGLAKSTTSRLLLALERNGLVAVAQPFLERLGKATGETINLGVASGGLVEQIAQVDSTYLIGGTNWVGMSVPLHCSALGKVLLAYGAAQLPGGPLVRRTDKTVTTDAALRAELAAVRTRGYAVTDEELEPGLIAVAAPIHGYDGAVVAALSVSAPTTRMSKDSVATVAGYCTEEAAGLSAVLGYRQRASRQNRKAGAA